ncbi:MAG: hypothetical protein R3292_12720 [Alcanivorax sp.]|nr:hypothetical protein [Alcanivorax sp.]
MTTNAYMWGWFAYLLGTVGVLYVWWWLTRPLARWVKVPLRTVLTAMLLTPWSVSPQHSEWAPAWVVTLFDGLAQESVSLWRAGGPLLAMLVVALIVAALELWRQQRKAARLTHDE